MYEHKKEMATQVNLSTRILSSNNIKNKSDDIMMSRERNARYFSSAPVPSYLALIACPPELPQPFWKIPTLLGVKECTHFQFPFLFSLFANSDFLTNSLQHLYDKVSANGAI